MGWVNFDRKNIELLNGRFYSFTPLAKPKKVNKNVHYQLVYFPYYKYKANIIFRGEHYQQYQQILKSLCHVKSHIKLKDTKEKYINIINNNDTLYKVQKDIIIHILVINKVKLKIFYEIINIYDYNDLINKYFNYAPEEMKDKINEFYLTYPKRAKNIKYLVEYLLKHYSKSEINYYASNFYEEYISKPIKLLVSPPKDEDKKIGL